MKKDQIDFVVKYLVVRIGSCQHKPWTDCGKCIGRWLRDAIKKSKSAK